MILLPPANEVWGKVMFSQVLSVHRGLSVPACITGHMTMGGLCQRVSVRGVSVQDGLCLGGSLSGRHLDRDSPPYGNERAVHILLECILVLNTDTKTRLCENG